MATPARIVEMNELPRSHAGHVRPGDVVRTGENLHPHYRVIAMNGDRAWVRDVQYGTDHVVQLEQVHRIEDVLRGPRLVEDHRRAHSRIRSR